jgi:hypothetical protein
MIKVSGQVSWRRRADPATIGESYPILYLWIAIGLAAVAVIVGMVE